ncbi:MAG: caspase family protein [Deltaproteobacteria bacterium]|nr:caspase family protein [Deltaproteobacteria bacterium]MBN2672684.1 caspase family protein [Deltaproteobacteria bacterium]
MAESNFRALLVGNGIFSSDPHNLPELNGPKNDLRMLEETLTHPQIGLFAKENVQVLKDCTKDEVLEAAYSFFSSAKRDDQLLFYYSGHGMLDKFNKLYFCTRDTKTTALLLSAVPDQTLNSMIQESISSRLIIIIDCCHSGRFKSGGLSENLQGEGRFVLTSSRSKELSQDARCTDEPSVFTRYLVDALLSSEVDTDKDGYISVNEVYNYILPKIYDETKQRPHRIYDKAVGDLALGKSRETDGDSGVPSDIGAGHGDVGAATEKPILCVSTELLNIDDVEAGETLPTEIIDVFNNGGGKLQWTSDCDDDWIEIEKFSGFIKVRFVPKIGTNRGRIYIRDSDTGQAKRIQVCVKVRESLRSPKLQITDDSVDFGTVSAGAFSPTYTVRLINTGDGELAPRVFSTDSWVRTNLYEDVLEITADTANPGVYAGTVRIESAGGSATISVRITVEIGPVLSVSPSGIKFGKVEEGEPAEHHLTIQNEGKGTLEWSYKTDGNFFSVREEGNKLLVALDSRQVGKFRGSIFVSGAGVEKTVPVEAVVVAREQPPPPTFVDISGTWNSAGGAGYFVGKGPQYQYSSTNFMGVKVEEGTAFVNNNQVTLQGYNVLTGAFTGSFQVVDNMMTGIINTVAGAVPITLQKTHGTVPNFMQSLASLFG